MRNIHTHSAELRKKVPEEVMKELQDKDRMLLTARRKQMVCLKVYGTANWLASFWISFNQPYQPKRSPKKIPTNATGSG